MRTLVVERKFAHTPQKIWRALTDPALLAEWLMSNDFKPEIGHKFQFRAKPVAHWDGIVNCEVLIIEPLKTLSYSWMTWTVTFTLTPTDDGVLLRMEQAGFGDDDKQAYGGAQYGWNMFFGKLDELMAQTE
jgi:uncharacterized protein YndB with AHSA1/START domain